MTTNSSLLPYLEEGTTTATNLTIIEILNFTNRKVQCILLVITIGVLTKIDTVLYVHFM